MHLCVPYRVRIQIYPGSEVEIRDRSRTPCHSEVTMKSISIVRFAGAIALALSAFITAQAFARPALPDVTVRGLVTCSRRPDLRQHKGFTRWSWAMYQVSQGDNIVLVASGKTYVLQGDR